MSSQKWHLPLRSSVRVDCPAASDLQVARACSRLTVPLDAVAARHFDRLRVNPAVSFESRLAMTSPTSSGSPTRPSAVWPASSASNSSLSPPPSSVRIACSCNVPAVLVGVRVR